ncbi:MAG: sulfotransferase family protein, partial [Saprospiraceae bacterium]
MALKVFGTGQGRTGTTSLKLALEHLGFGKCYHMFELMAHPDQIIYFEKAERGEKVDWDKLFEGYQSACDMPVIRYYEDILKRYPDAKLVHTTRDPDSWYQSMMSTIFWAL